MKKENITKNNSNVVLSLSGGMDSSTLLAYYLSQGNQVHAVSFKYGSKHQDYELAAAISFLKYYQRKGYPVNHSIIDMREPFKGIQSNLMQNGGEIPEGHYEADVMRLTVVPGRNLIFASILAAIGESEKADLIALGIHAGDHHIYPDCRPEFLIALRRIIDASTAGKIKVEAPFIDKTKKDILKYGHALAVPYDLTRTCYKNQELSCGKCGSCIERLEAFTELGITDPLEYEV